jgi:hypothetical protein
VMADAFQEAPEDLAARLQASDLRSFDDPSPKETLLAAGLATAPALMRAVRKFVALIEMPAAAFQDAREGGTLDLELDQVVTSQDDEPLVAARARATRAFEHLAQNVGVSPGEVMASLTTTVWEALEQAAGRIASQPSPELSPSLTGSPEPTDGLDEMSSTTPLTGTL